MHPCFHGLSKKEFNLITGKDYSIDLEDQIEALKRLVMAGIDVYPTFGTNVCDPSNIKSFYEGLKTISPNLPLKVALVKYDCDYQPVASRIAPKTERKPPLFSKFAALRIWNQLLLRDYGIGYAVFPRNLVTYGPLISRINDAVSSEGIAKEPEILFFFKSSYRDLYHKEILDMLAFPNNHIFEITYDKQWVQDDLFFHMGTLPEGYKERKCLWFYVDRYSPFSLIPLRYGEIVEVKNSTGVLALKIKLNDYLTFSNGVKDLKGKIRATLRQYFGSGTVPPGGKLVLLGEDFTNTIRTPASASEICISSAFELKGKPILSGDSSGFRRVVDELNECKDMKRSLFYRLTLIDLKKDEGSEKTGKTLYTIKGGKSFKIVVDYYQPNYQEFDERQPQQRAIVFESSNPKIKIIGTPSLVFSKYGSREVFFRTESVVHEEEIAINIHSPYDDFRAANITLNIQLKPTHVENALRSLFAAFLLAVGSTGFTIIAMAAEKRVDIWTLAGELYSQYDNFSTVTLFILLTLCFFGVFFFKSAGISAKP